MTLFSLTLLLVMMMLGMTHPKESDSSIRSESKNTAVEITSWLRGEINPPSEQAREKKGDEDTNNCLNKHVHKPNITTLAHAGPTHEPNITTPVPDNTTLELNNTNPVPDGTSPEPNNTTPVHDITLQPNNTTPVTDSANLKLNITTLVSQTKVPSSQKPVPDSNPHANSPEIGALGGDIEADNVNFEFVSLVGHSYQGVVVHIGDSVPYSEILINNIEKLFNLAQDALESATRPKKAEDGAGLTFGRVIITVPSNWEKDFAAPPVSLGPPSIRVEPPSSSHGHVPYTLQPGGCGERGLYIHLTPEFVCNMFNESVKGLIGKAESVLVHEWAHLRWGVFDEYVTPDVLALPHQSLARPFYLDDEGQVRPSGCPLNIKGWIVEEVNEDDPNTSSPATNGTSKMTSNNNTPVNMSSEATNPEQGRSTKYDERKSSAMESITSLRLCKSFTKKGLPAPHCFFYSDSKQETNGSLMSYFPNYQLSSEGKRFCGDGEGAVSHDPAAPTPHNLLCGGRSVWEVMREHDDFASHCGHQRKRRQTPQTHTPTSTPRPKRRFIFYKRQNPKALLLILDCSQLPNDRLSSIKHDLIRFRETFVPMDTKVLALTSQSLDQGTEDLTTALTCDSKGTDNVTHTAANWLKRQSFSHSLVLTLLFSSDRRRYEQLSPGFPLNSSLHAVTIEQACPDELLKTRERRFSCTEHRNGDDIAETLRRVLASYSTGEELTQVYVQSHPLQHAFTGRPGTKTSVSGNFFMNFCRGSSIISVIAPTRVLGRNSSYLDMSLVHDGTETPMSLYEQKLYAGSERVNIVIKIPCGSAHGDWEYVIRIPSQSPPTVQEGPPETVLTVDVMVYQHEDEDTAVRISTFILVKKRLSMNCTLVDQPLNSNGSGSGSSNESSRGNSSDSSNDRNITTERSKYNGAVVPLPQKNPEPSSSFQLTNLLGGNNQSLPSDKDIGTIKCMTYAEKLKKSLNCKTTNPSVSSNNSANVQSQKNSQIKRSSRGVLAEQSDEADPSKESGEQPKVHIARIISYNDSLLRIVSVVTQGGKGEQTPVLGASVMAIVSKEGSPDFLKVLLLDSGLAADEIADDGIYSGFLMGISGNGRYSVSVEATDAKSSRRKINTIRQTLFLDQHRQEKNSLGPSGSELYLMKVRCSAVHTASTLLVQLQSASSDEASSPLVDLERDDHNGSSSGSMYSGQAKITHSGKLIVPNGCILIALIGQGGGALDSLAPSSHRRSPDRSFAPVLPTRKNYKLAFNSTSTNTFSRHLPALEEGQEDGSGDNGGVEKGISKKSNVKEKEVLELTAETSKFRVKRAVEVLEVVEYTSRDILPPGRVRDLTVTKVHYIRPAVTLEWSSPGDDLYSGTAHRIDLRYYKSQEALQMDFLGATPVMEEKHVPPGALKPLPAGEKQSVIIFLKELSLDDLEEDYTLHFGLIVWDEASNAGDLSNLAEARFTVTEKQKELMDQTSSKQLMNIAIFLLAAVITVVLVLVCFAKIKAHLQKRKKADCYDFAYSDITTYTKFGTNQRNRSRESSTKAGGASHSSASGNTKMKSTSGQSKPGKPDGVRQNRSMSEYRSQEPKEKQINYYGTK